MLPCPTPFCQGWADLQNFITFSPTVITATTFLPFPMTNVSGMTYPSATTLWEFKSRYVPEMRNNIGGPFSLFEGISMKARLGLSGHRKVCIVFFTLVRS